MKETLYQFNPWWEDKEHKLNLFVRDRYLIKLRQYLEIKDIIFLIGIRRVGKTSLMKQLIFEILNSGINSKNILYLSCEHPKFNDFNLIEIINEYRSYFNITRDEKVYVFFDEVQLKIDFERDLKIIYDTEKNIKIFASGSSATLIKDKKAYLTGRHRTLEIEPLNFEEYLIFVNKNVKISESYLYKQLFLDYLKIGGMPEYVLNNDPEYLINLIDSIIYKDIIGNYNLKNPKLIKDLFILLCERVGKPLSYTKLANILGVSVDTVSQYISYFEETFLIYIVNKYSSSLNEKVRSQKKIYIADVGLRNILVGFKDLGAIYENLVFIKIKSDSPEYYFKDGKEVDFVLKSLNTAIEAKFKEKISDLDLQNLNELDFEKKILAKDYTFFIEK